MERSNLHIASVQLSDAGDYVCQASNVLGVRRSRPAALSVSGNVRKYIVLLKFERHSVVDLNHYGPSEILNSSRDRCEKDTPTGIFVHFK